MAKTNKGFTLAEVLITLVIIGIVAAIAVPSVMNITNAKEYKSAYKKAISAANQALELNFALTGLTAQDYTTPEAITAMLKSHMSVIAYVPGSSVNTNNFSNFYGLIPAAYAAGSSSGFVQSVPSKDAPIVVVSPSASEENAEIEETAEEGTFTNTSVCSGTNVWASTDGVIFCVAPNYTSDNDSSQKSTCNAAATVACSSDGEANLFVDVNGARKPNKLTTSASAPKDIFPAMIYSQKVVPFGDAAQQVMYDKQISASK